MATVTNINGTSDNICKCGSWLQHWKNFENSSKTYCSEKDCLGKDLVGAHVQKVNSTDHNWYIVPLCKAHNNVSSLTVLDIGSTALVSANKSETCDKD